MTMNRVHGAGHSPVCRILLQIVVKTVITSSPPAWTSPAGMLSTSLSSVIVLQPHFFAKDGVIILCVCLGTVNTDGSPLVL